MTKAKIYLYKEGNECTSITGGWDESLFTIDSSYARVSVTKESEYMLFNITSNSKMSRIGCNNLINFSLFSSLFLDTYFYYTNNGTGYYAGGEIDADKTFGGRLEKVSLENMLGHKIVNQKIISTGNNYFSIYSSIAPIAYVNPNKFCITNVYVETKENVLTINSQENDNITFSANDLGLVTISKIDVLVNGIVSKTYTDEYSKLSYTVDKSLCYIGNNNIEIRVTYSQGDDITETVSEYLTYKYDVSQLPLETPLLDTVERVKLLTNSRQNEKTMLSSILTSKNVEVTEEDKMSDLIGKVNEMDYSKMYLYKSGKKNIDFSYLTLSYYPQIGIYNENSDHIFLKVNVNQGLLFRTTSLVDTSQYSKLCFEYESSIPIENTYNAYSFGCSTNDTIASTDIEYQSKKTENRRIYSFDLSTYNKLAYIFLKLECYAGDSVDVNIYNIWLEK